MATKTKPRPAAKKAPAKKAPANKKAPAKKASPKAAAKPKAEVSLLAAETLVKFTGYRSEMAEDEIVFQPDDTLFIVEVDDNGDDGVLYSAINAKDIAAYEEDPDSVDGGQVAPSEVSELKGTALDKARDAFMPIPVIGKLADLLAENSNPVEVAIELNQEIQETYFWLGGALAQVLQGGLYLKENGGDFDGEEAFNDFCQAEFGFKASKGRQLARIYMTFSSLPDFDPNALAGIGWSIAAKAEKYVTAENVEEVLEVAAGETQRTVDAVLKEKFVKENTTPSGKAASRGANRLVTVALNFKLGEDAAEAVKLAMQACMKQNGIENENLALEHICTEWASEHVEGTTMQKKITAKANKSKKARAAAAK